MDTQRDPALHVGVRACVTGRILCGIRLKADGEPNLSAPALKTADGKPDLSGIWAQQNSRTTGYYLDGIDVPWQPWAKALFDQRTVDNLIDNPESKCLPRGTPKADAFDLHKIIQMPDLIVILYDYHTTYRQIFLDGRELPKDPNPTWGGYSVGRWEGDTLVVESNGFNGKAWLSGRGNPITDALHLTERMRRRDFGHMDIQLTFDDPRAYTKPWKAELHPELVPNTELMEFVCTARSKVYILPLSVSSFGSPNAYAGYEMLTGGAIISASLFLSRGGRADQLASDLRRREIGRGRTRS